MKNCTHKIFTALLTVLFSATSVYAGPATVLDRRDPRPAKAALALDDQIARPQPQNSVDAFEGQAVIKLAQVDAGQLGEVKFPQGIRLGLQETPQRMAGYCSTHANTTCVTVATGTGPVMIVTNRSTEGKLQQIRWYVVENDGSYRIREMESYEADGITKSRESNFIKNAAGNVVRVHEAIYRNGQLREENFYRDNGTYLLVKVYGTNGLVREDRSYDGAENLIEGHKYEYDTAGNVTEKRTLHYGPHVTVLRTDYEYPRGHTFSSGSNLVLGENDTIQVTGELIVEDGASLHVGSTGLRGFVKVVGVFTLDKNEINIIGTLETGPNAVFDGALYMQSGGFEVGQPDNGGELIVIGPVIPEVDLGGGIKIENKHADRFDFNFNAGEVHAGVGKIGIDNNIQLNLLAGGQLHFEILDNPLKADIQLLGIHDLQIGHGQIVLPDLNFNQLVLAPIQKQVLDPVLDQLGAIVQVQRHEEVR